MRSVMSAYLIGEFEVTNPAGLAPYRAAVNDTIVRHGGRFIIRGGATLLKEGGPPPKYVVVIEFPNADALERWWRSPEYQEILPFRLNNTTGRVFTVDGVE